MPSLLVLTGCPGAGKTAVAAQLAAASPRGVHVVGDAFHAFLAHPVPPVLPESHAQNEVVVDACVRAAAAYAAGGYRVVLEGIFGPWFLPRMAPVLLEFGLAADYAVLRPSLTDALRRAGGRAETPAPEAVVRHMHRAFATLGPFEPFVLDVTGCDVETVAAELRGRRRAGGLRLDLPRLAVRAGAARTVGRAGRGARTQPAGGRSGRGRISPVAAHGSRPAEGAREGDLVQSEEAEGVRTLTLASPPGNALGLALVGALHAALGEAEADAACRAVVLRGAPGVFSEGLDAGDAAEAGAGRRAFAAALHALLDRLYGLPKPTVAAITGQALGAGLVLALACDLRLAAEGTYRLGLDEAASGRPFPEGLLVVVRHELDPQTARRLLLTSLPFGPRDRLARPFVDAVTEVELLPERAAARARALAGLPAFAEVKRHLRAPALAELERLLPRRSGGRARGPGGG